MRARGAEALEQVEAVELAVASRDAAAQGATLERLEQADPQRAAEAAPTAARDVVEQRSMAVRAAVQRAAALPEAVAAVRDEGAARAPRARAQQQEPASTRAPSMGAW